MGEKFYEENRGNVLAEAMNRGYDILDCCIVVDLCGLYDTENRRYVNTHSVEVRLLRDYVGSALDENRALLSTLEEKKDRVPFIFVLNGSGTTAHHGEF